MTFREFEAVKERPDFCAKANKHASIWRWQPTQHINVIKDNMWHIRNLVADLLDSGLLREGKRDDVLADIETTMRRMWALLSVAFGNFGEVGLLCTVMDSLLEDLAGCFVGFQDPKMETTRMQKVVQAIAKEHGQSSAKLTSFMSLDSNALERSHRARLVFGEIARFYRGAIMYAVSKVSATYHHTSKDQKEIWYENLLKFFDECGHPGCREQLKVSRMDWGKVDDEDQVKGPNKRKGKGKATEKPSGEAEDAGGAQSSKEKKKWTVSIAVKDARIGFPDER